MEEASYLVYFGIAITEWIKAIGVLVGVPYTLYLIWQIKQSSKNRALEIESLVKMATQQVGINDTLQSQLAELKEQTKDVHNQSLYMIDLNRLNEQNFDLEKQKYLESTTNRRKQIRNYFLLCLDSLLEPLNQQIESLKVLVKKLDQPGIQKYLLRQHPRLDFPILNSIPTGELFSSFIADGYLEKKQDLELYSEIEINLHFISNFSNSCFEIMKEFRGLKDLYKSEWDKSILQLHNDIEDCIINARLSSIDYSEDDFLFEINKRIGAVIEELQNSVSRDMYLIYESYLIPLREICDKYLNNPKAAEYLQYINKCELSLTNMNRVKHSYASLYQTQINNLEHASNNISSFVYAIRQSK